MIVSIMENAHDTIASVRDEQGVVLWSRADEHVWSFLGYLSPDGTTLETVLRPADIQRLAAHEQPLVEAFDAYVRALPE